MVSIYFRSKILCLIRKLYTHQDAMSIPISNSGVVPASLSFLAIYNPSLSRSEETLHDQIVYYYSRSDSTITKHKARGNAGNEDSHGDKNERLRQIGLAQGMVEFAK